MGGDLIPLFGDEGPDRAPVLPGDQPGPDGPEVHLPTPRPGAELEPAVVEAELVEEDQAAAEVEVRPAIELDVAPWSSRTVERRPLVAPWLATAEARRRTVRWAVGHGGYWLAFKALHSPQMAWRACVQVPIGAARVAGAVLRYGWDHESAQVARAAAAAGETSQYLALQRMASDRRVLRAKLLGLAAVLLAGGYVSLRLFAPPHVGTLVLLAVLGLLSWAGRRPDRPVMTPVVVKAGYARLTWPILARALAAAGLGGKAPRTAKDGTATDDPVGQPTLAEDLTREGGQGWRALVDLPYGRTAEDAFAARGRIASGLDCSPQQVFIEGRPESARRVLLYVADRDPFVGKPTPSPLGKCPPCSVFDAYRLGVEPRGRAVAAPLIWNGFVVGALPRQGKTFCVRTLIAPAILDPFCDVSVLGAKSSDWEHTEGVAVAYRAGEGDDDTVEYVVAALRRLKTEIQARYDRLRELPRDQRPEGKVTPELARHGFAPHVVVVEEAQNIFGHRDASGTKQSALAKEALYLATFVAKVGPAAGYVLVLATQRPSAEVVPSDLRDVLSVKIALKVNDRNSSDVILGDYRHARGIESVSLIPDLHRGVATVVGIPNGRGGDHAQLRVDLIDDAAFTRICQVGRQRRIDAGTLRGHAAGDVDQVQVAVSLPHDVVAVWPAGEPKATGEELAQRLAAHRPELYGGWGADTLTRALQVPEEGRVQVKRGGVNQRGYLLSAIVKMAAQSGSGGVAGSSPEQER